MDFNSREPLVSFQNAGFDPNKSYGAGQSGSTAGTGDNVNQNGQPKAGDDYSVMVERGQRAPAERGARGQYDIGHSVSSSQYRSATQLVNEWRHADHARVAALQSQLVAAGYLKKGSYIPGIFDEDTEQAYYLTMRSALVSDKTPSEVLMERAKARAAAGMGGEEGAENPPLTIDLTNPADIRKAIKDQALDTLGRKLSDKEAETFVALYQGMEAAKQRQSYSQQYGAPGHYGPGGTSVSAPSLGAFTEEEIRKRYPTEAGAHDIANAGAAFFEMLGS